MSGTGGHASGQNVIADDAASQWLKAALQSALERDPVDALNDALLLAGFLEERLRRIFALSGMGEPSDE
jgi:hypothetical protein